jgi:hypothetical protein
MCTFEQTELLRNAFPSFRYSDAPTDRELNVLAPLALAGFAVVAGMPSPHSLFQCVAAAAGMISSGNPDWRAVRATSASILRGASPGGQLQRLFLAEYYGGSSPADFTTVWLRYCADVESGSVVAAAPPYPWAPQNCTTAMSGDNASAAAAGIGFGLILDMYSLTSASGTISVSLLPALLISFTSFEAPSAPTRLSLLISGRGHFERLLRAAGSLPPAFPLHLSVAGVAAALQAHFLLTRSMITGSVFSEEAGGGSGSIPSATNVCADILRAVQSAGEGALLTLGRLKLELRKTASELLSSDEYLERLFLDLFVLELQLEGAAGNAGLSLQHKITAIKDGVIEAALSKRSAQLNDSSIFVAKISDTFQHLIETVRVQADLLAEVGAQPVVVTMLRALAASLDSLFAQRAEIAEATVREDLLTAPLRHQALRAARDLRALELRYDILAAQPPALLAEQAKLESRGALLSNEKARAIVAGDIVAASYLSDEGSSAQLRLGVLAVSLAKIVSSAVGYQNAEALLKVARDDSYRVLKQRIALVDTMREGAFSAAAGLAVRALLVVSEAPVTLPASSQDQFVDTKNVSVLLLSLMRDFFAEEAAGVAVQYGRVFSLPDIEACEGQKLANEAAAATLALAAATATATATATAASTAVAIAAATSAATAAAGQIASLPPPAALAPAPASAPAPAPAPAPALALAPAPVPAPLQKVHPLLVALAAASTVAIAQPPRGQHTRSASAPPGSLTRLIEPVLPNESAIFGVGSPLLPAVAVSAAAAAAPTMAAAALEPSSAADLPGSLRLARERLKAAAARTAAAAETAAFDALIATYAQAPDAAASACAATPASLAAPTLNPPPAPAPVAEAAAFLQVPLRLAPVTDSAEALLVAAFKEMGVFEGGGESVALALSLLMATQAGKGSAPGAGGGGGSSHGDLD